MGEGKVIGVDREIPQRTRDALCSHPLAARISLLEGDSADPQIVAQVAGAGRIRKPGAGDSRLRPLARSCRARTGVLRAAGHQGSYIVATDGIMKDIADVPRALPEWKTDNPFEAANDFAARHPEFRQQPPAWLSHQAVLTENVTYWPGAWLQRVK